MGLMLKTQRNGILRDCWYGVYTDESGTRRVVNLNVKWQGTPPNTGRLRDNGDAAFERSRERAQSALDAFAEEARHKGRAESLTERLIESKTGEKIHYVQITELAQKWRELSRDEKPTERYLLACAAHFKRFADFMASRNPKTEYLHQIRQEDASAFRNHCRDTLAPATARYGIRLIKKACSYFLPIGCKNPFAAHIAKTSDGESGVVHRRPLTVEELRHLLDVAREDPFLHGLAVTAAMTGMRRADVCQLRWESCDLAAGMLDVTTGKTKARVSIPIWKPLREILNKQGSKKKGFVFPEAAQMLEGNPNGLTYRMKRLFARAFSKEQDSPALPYPNAADLEKEAIVAIMARVPSGQQRTRMIDTMRRYAAGQGLPTIAEKLKVSKSTVSLDLHAIEKLIGKQFLRSRITRVDTKAAVADLTRIDRENGQRAASVLDWHCFRTSWITLALANGVPETTVRAVTGHSAVDIVIKHYFKPNRAQLREALAGALPDVLTGGASKGKQSAAEELAALASKIQSGGATDADRKRLRSLAAKV